MAEHRREGPARRASSAEELTFVAGTVWVLVGLCLDGWAHRHQPELESFWTPWHAVFYSGFAATAAWVAVMTIRRRPTSPDLRAAIPDGYGGAVVGLGVFGLGGIGDAIWHSVFGVESSLDALLSPTHLVLLGSMLLAATAPVRAAWRDPADPVEPASLRVFLPVTLSLTVATTGVAFFFLYANGFNNWPMNRRYDPFGTEVEAALGVLSTVASTVILLAPVIVCLRRWRPPVGAFTVLFGLVGAFLAGLDAFDHSWQLIGPIVGGATADAIVAQRRAGDGLVSARRALVCGAVVPLAMWSVSTVALHLAWGVLWPPELWLGAILMAMLTGFGLTLVAFDPAVPDDRPTEREATRTAL